MNYVIDTHILLWSIFDPEKLDNKHIKLIENSKNKIFITSISLWEISLKFGLCWYGNSTSNEHTY